MARHVACFCRLNLPNVRVLTLQLLTSGTPVSRLDLPNVRVLTLDSYQSGPSRSRLDLPNVRVLTLILADQQT